MYVMLETAAAGSTGALMSSLIPFALVIAVMYFMVIRPQKKKDKKMDEMRSNIEVGDSIVTIGGIVGHVASIKDDTIVLETVAGNKIRFKRWAISEVTKLDN